MERDLGYGTDATIRQMQQMQQQVQQEVQQVQQQAQQQAQQQQMQQMQRMMMGGGGMSRMQSMAAGSQDSQGDAKSQKTQKSSGSGQGAAVAPTMQMMAPMVSMPMMAPMAAMMQMQMQMQMGAMAQMQMQQMQLMGAMAAAAAKDTQQPPEEDDCPPPTECTAEVVAEVEREVQEAEKAAKAKWKEEGKYVGLVARYLEDNGFGFITCAECQDEWEKTDIFISGREFVANDLEVGDIVSFVVAKDTKGLPRVAQPKTLKELTKLRRKLNKMRWHLRSASSKVLAPLKNGGPPASVQSSPSGMLALPPPAGLSPQGKPRPMLPMGGTGPAQDAPVFVGNAPLPAGLARLRTQGALTGPLTQSTSRSTGPAGLSGSVVPPVAPPAAPAAKSAMLLRFPPGLATGLPRPQGANVGASTIADGALQSQMPKAMAAPGIRAQAPPIMEELAGHLDFDAMQRRRPLLQSGGFGEGGGAIGSGGDMDFGDFSEDAQDMPELKRPRFDYGGMA